MNLEKIKRPIKITRVEVALVNEIISLAGEQNKPVHKNASFFCAKTGFSRSSILTSLRRMAKKDWIKTELVKRKNEKSGRLCPNQRITTLNYQKIRKDLMIIN